jgi:DNA-binding transcriptional LysR family regulator
VNLPAAAAARSDDLSDHATTLDLKQLRYFLAICKARTYARASEALGITQSALTQSIVRLEHNLGVRLFERGRHGAMLTAHGQLLYPRAQVMLAEAEAAASELRHTTQMSRAKVAVGLGKSIVGNLMPEAIRRMRTTRPDVALTVLEGWSPELYAKLLQGELDFVVSAPLPHYVVDLELRQEQLFSQHEAVLIGRRHPLAGKDNIDLAELSRCLWLLPPEGNGRSRFLRRVFQDAGLDPPAQSVRSDCTQVGIGLLRNGLAVAHGVLEVVREHMTDDEFRVVPIPALLLERPVYVTLRRRSRLQPAAHLFLDVVRAVCADVVAQRPFPSLAAPAAAAATRRR